MSHLLLVAWFAGQTGLPAMLASARGRSNARLTLVKVILQDEALKLGPLDLATRGLRKVFGSKGHNMT